MAPKADTDSAVIKRTLSIPKGLFKFAEAEAARIAKQKGEKPNLSRYFSDLLAAAKFNKK